MIKELSQLLNSSIKLSIYNESVLRDDLQIESDCNRE